MNFLFSFLGIVTAPRKTFQKVLEGSFLAVSQALLVLTLLSYLILDWNNGGSFWRRLVYAHDLSKLLLFLVLILPAIHRLAVSLGLQGKFKNLWVCSSLALTIKLLGHAAVHLQYWVSRSLHVPKPIVQNWSGNLQDVFTFWFLALCFIGIVKSYSRKQKQYEEPQSSLQAFGSIFLYPVEMIKAINEKKFEPAGLRIALGSLITLSLILVLEKYYRGFGVVFISHWRSVVGVFLGFFVVLMLCTLVWKRGETKSWSETAILMSFLMGFVPLALVLAHLFIFFDGWLGAISLGNATGWLSLGLLFYALFLALCFLRIGLGLKWIFPRSVWQYIEDKEFFNALNLLEKAWFSVSETLKLRTDWLIHNQFLVWLFFLVASFVFTRQILFWLMTSGAAPLVAGSTFLFWILFSIGLFWGIAAVGYVIWVPLTWANREIQRAEVVRSIAWVFSLVAVIGALFGNTFANGDNVKAGITALGLILAALLIWRHSKIPFFGFAGLLIISAVIILVPLFLPLYFLYKWVLVKAAVSLVPALLILTIVFSGLARPFREFHQRFGTAFFAAASFLFAGTLLQWLFTPSFLYRHHCLSPGTVMGVSQKGGVFVRNRSGDIFLGTTGRGWSAPLAFPRKLKLGRIRQSPNHTIYALEFKTYGDRFWRTYRGGDCKPVEIQSNQRESFFIADFDVDGENRIVALDAYSWRILILSTEGRIVQTLLPPVNVGTPNLVSCRDGSIYLWTQSGRIIEFSSDGTVKKIFQSSITGNEIVDFIALEDRFLFQAQLTEPDPKTLFYLVRNLGYSVYVETVDPEITSAEIISADKDGQLYTIFQDKEIHVKNLLNNKELGRIAAREDIRAYFNRSPVRAFLSRLAGETI